MNLVKMLVVGLIIALQPLFMYGQVVIGHAPPDGSAALDIQGTTMGVLLPRLTTAERNAITAPATGLMIFNTTTFCLEVNNGTGSSPEWSAFRCRRGAVTSLDCAGVTVTGTLTAGQAASGVSASVPYMGGNIGVYSDQEVSSTGVTGLTATLSAGTLADGSGSISFDITGTPSGGGVASFALNFGGQSCTVAVNVAYVCKAKTDATTFSNFLCYNLGAANTSADPFTPSWEINGGYWQWGRVAEAAAGPTGPGSGSANAGDFTNWNSSSVPVDSWADGFKTAKDPCPSGFRLPTKAQWEGVLANNTVNSIGSFSSSATNYSAGKTFGDNLMLPTAGNRDGGQDGVLYNRGSNGYYWSSTSFGTSSAWLLQFNSSTAYMHNTQGAYGLSVRCIAE